MISDAATLFLSKRGNINILMKENQKQSKAAIKSLHVKPKEDSVLINELQDELDKAWGEISSLRKELEKERKSRKDAKLDRALDLLISIKDTVENKEKVIVIRELTNEEAMRILKEDILPTADTLSSVDIADALCIPLRQAHTLYLQLLDEGILRLD